MANERKGNALQLLEQLRVLGGLPAQASAQVRIEGCDPVVRTVYPVAESGAATIAAAGMAAAWLWKQSHGEAQQVHVDADAATAAMQSFRFMAFDGKPPQAPMDRMTNFYRAQDGRWVYLHCNFPNLAAKNCAVLGAQQNHESLAAQVARWNAQALEDALAAAGGVGVLVRTEEEWRAHPQGIAAAAAPPMEILRIGNAPPEPLPLSDRPLGGVRVLDLTRVLAGPTCAKTLAEHGADVLKISREGMAHSGELDFDTGLGKLSAFLNLRDPVQLQTLRDLVRDCDVFSQAYRPGAMDKLGLSPADLAVLRPGIVAVSLDAWGFTGPWKDRRGYDTVVQSANGMALSSGGERPVCLPVSVQDYAAGYLMAYGAMAALSRRVSQGGSWLVRVSLAACGEWVRRHPRIAAGDCADRPLQVPPDVVQPWLAHSPSPAGMFTHLGSVTRMARTPTRWARPLVALGASPAQWPARGT